MTMRFLETLGFFSGLGIVILFIAALALGEVGPAKLATRRYRERMADAFDRTDEYGPAY